MNERAKIANFLGMKDGYCPTQPKIKDGKIECKVEDERICDACKHSEKCPHWDSYLNTDPNTES